MTLHVRTIFACFLVSVLSSVVNGIGTSDGSTSKSGRVVSQSTFPSTAPVIPTNTGTTYQAAASSANKGTTNPAAASSANTGTTYLPTPGISQATVNNDTSNPSVFVENIQKFLENFQVSNTIQKQIGSFIKANNVSFPISIMTPENLQNVLKFLGPASSNLQGLSQFAGQLVNIPNELRNSTNDLEHDISPQCYDHLQFIVSELMKREQWAIKMIDATGKLSSGLMDGNLFWSGSYDECLSVNAAEKFDGQYCTATISLASILGDLFPMAAAANLHLGVCMPDSCTAMEINTVLNTTLGLLPLGENSLQTSATVCSERAEYDDLAIGGFTVCGVFGVLMLLSTLFDVLYNHHQRKSTKTVPHENGTSPESKYQVNGDVAEKPKTPTQPGILAKLAMTFSVYTNGKKLISTEQGGGALSAINGIRFISITWVVLGHSFSSALNTMQNPTFIREFISNWSSMPMVNALLSVDSFFTLSGLLVSYLFMKEMKREKGRINWFMFYFHRFWRLTPAYMLVLFLDMSLFRYLGDGPFWAKEGIEPFCKDTWWTNLLYINNLYRNKEMCFGWAWYLANDMQFYVVSPLLLVPLYFSKKIGLFVNSLALLGITIATAVVSSRYELDVASFSADNLMADMTHYFYDYYVVPWCRMGPYIVGIVTGYIIYRTNGQYKIPKGINLLIWIAFAVTACLVVYGINGPVHGHTWSNGVNALYNAVHRSVWGMCVCWVIFACVTGNGGIINDFLSWKLFVPLGRLSYCIYLTHLLVISYYIQTLRQPLYATTLQFTFIFLGSLMLSIPVSIVASLAFEAPMMALEKIIFRRSKK
ncbi:nose resistant to fluoxetine protein 6-like [Argopecten irradians]|uniref:nose resistant to fluoxetine protein 6-like n=1 Tax=Argopecten irradians TaxID=31199 RepID=UPI003722CE20